MAMSQYSTSHDTTTVRVDRKTLEDIKRIKSEIWGNEVAENVPHEKAVRKLIAEFNRD